MRSFWINAELTKIYRWLPKLNGTTNRIQKFVVRQWNVMKLLSGIVLKTNYILSRSYDLRFYWNTVWIVLNDINMAITY